MSITFPYRKEYEAHLDMLYLVRLFFFDSMPLIKLGITIEVLPKRFRKDKRKRKIYQEVKVWSGHTIYYCDVAPFELHMQAVFEPDKQLGPPNFKGRTEGFPDVPWLEEALKV